MDKGVFFEGCLFGFATQINLRADAWFARQSLSLSFYRPIDIIVLAPGLGAKEIT